MVALTYRINEPSGDGRERQQPSITCLLCGFTSYSACDVQNLFCGNCDLFHTDYRLAVAGLGQDRADALYRSEPPRLGVKPGFPAVGPAMPWAAG